MRRQEQLRSLNVCMEEPGLLGRDQWGGGGPEESPRSAALLLKVTPTASTL